MSSYKYKKILEGIATLTKNYSNVYRGTVNYELYKQIIKNNPELSEKFHIEYLRESLISHVWHISIVATYLHQFIHNKNKTDLWKVLKILSIHDIWETIVWDVITTARNRTQQEEKDEYKAVKSLLNDEQILWYNEMIEMQSNEAKFAKSIDKISPDILAYCCYPPIEKARLKYFGFNLKDVLRKKKEFMEWDDFLDGFFNYLIHQTQKNHNLYD